MINGARTIGRIFKFRSERSPDRKAIGWIENGEIKSLTFKEYRKQVEILASALHKIGLTVGDKLAILAQTSKEWHLLDMAGLCSRICIVPIYPSYLGHEIDFIFCHSDSGIIVVENDKQIEKILPHIGNWKNLKAIISIQELSEENIKKFRNSYAYFNYKDLIRIGTEELKTHPDILDNHIQNQLPEEMASIIYTSGTTGNPKGAVITHHAFASMLMNIEKSVQGGFTHLDRSLVFLPLSHVMGRCDSLLPLVFSWQAVYAESMEKLMENIQVVQPTVMLAVPRIFEKIYEKTLSKVEESNMVERHTFKWALHVAKNYFHKIDQDLSPSASELIEFKLAQKLVLKKIYNHLGGKIRYFISGGAPLSVDIIQFLRYANLTVLEGYGLTETIAPCCLNPMAKQLPGSVGRPLGDVQFSFAEDGEILIRSQALFKEYYKNPEATHEALKDGWFHTGDIGEFSAEGYLKITDRKKDLIKTSGGKYIAPQKIENMAKTHPYIAHIVLIGDKRKFLTALVGIEKEAFLPLLDEFGLTTDCSMAELAKHESVQKLISQEIDKINQGLAQFESIKKFQIVPEEFSLENFLTPSLKVKRKLVAERYAGLVEAMYQ